MREFYRILVVLPDSKCRVPRTIIFEKEVLCYYPPIIFRVRDNKFGKENEIEK